MATTSERDRLENTRRQLSEILASEGKEQGTRSLPPVYVRWLIVAIIFGMAGAYPAEVRLIFRFTFFSLTGLSCLIAMHDVPGARRCVPRRG